LIRTMEAQMSAFGDTPREVAGLIAQPQYAKARTHPMIIVAAGAVTLFALVGIGVLTGVIPNAYSENRTATPHLPGVLPTVAGAAIAPIGTNADVAPIVNEPTKTLQAPTAREPKTPAAVAPSVPTAEKQMPPAPTAPVVVPAATPVVAPIPRYETRYEQPSSGRERTVATNTASSNGRTVSNTVSTLPDASVNPSASNNGVIVATNAAQTGNVVTTRVEAPTSCANCGTVDSINKVSEPGQGSGVGAVIGGVVGGAIGRQMGNGRGRDVATVAGAVAGGLIGNQVEKSGKTVAQYEVRVKLEDGTYQTVKADTEPAVRIGDRVRIERGRVERIN
jgi:outer membrane lipoprotein SlyB